MVAAVVGVAVGVAAAALTVVEEIVADVHERLHNGRSLACGEASGGPGFDCDQDVKVGLFAQGKSGGGTVLR